MSSYDYGKILLEFAMSSVEHDDFLPGDLLVTPNDGQSTEYLVVRNEDESSLKCIVDVTNDNERSLNHITGSDSDECVDDSNGFAIVRHKDEESFVCVANNNDENDVDASTNVSNKNEKDVNMLCGEVKDKVKQVDDAVCIDIYIDTDNPVGVSSENVTDVNDSVAIDDNVTVNYSPEVETMETDRIAVMASSFEGEGVRSVGGTIVKERDENNSVRVEIGSDKNSDTLGCVASDNGISVDADISVRAVSDESQFCESGFKCEICDHNFTRKHDLSRHLKQHYPERGEKCAICDQYFTRLKVHMQRHTERERYICQRCDKVFVSKNGLKYHLSKHTGKYRYLCSICGEGFNHLNDLVGHNTKCTGEKSFKCTKCDKLFTHKSYLGVHTKSCGEKNSQYKCIYCSKCFKQKRYLKEHENGHENPERFQCSVCGCFFKHRGSLYKHMKKMGHKQQN